MIELVDIELYDPHREQKLLGARIDLLDGPVVLTETLGVTLQLALSFKPIGDSDVEIHLEERTIVRLTLSGLPVGRRTREFRVTSVERDFTGERSATAAATGLEAEIDAYPVAKNYAGRMDRRLYWVGRAAQDVLDELLSSETGCQPLFRSGGVAVELSTHVDITTDGQASRLTLIREIARQVGGEMEVLYNDDDDAYDVSIVAAVGRSPEEALADAPDPASRPVDVDARGNRMSLQRRRGGERWTSRVVPEAAEGDDLISIGGARWPVLAALVSGGSTALTLGGDPIYQNDAPTAGAYFGWGENWFAVTETTAPALVTVTGDASALTQGRFAIDADGTELIYLDDVAAVERGGVEAEVLRLGVAAAENLLTSADVSADLSGWTGGPDPLPIGWQPVDDADSGSPVITAVDDGDLIAHGSRAARIVMSAVGQGLETDPIPFTPSAIAPYVSAWAALRVESGDVRLFIVDAAGTELPLEGYAGSNVNDLRQIAIEAEQPGEGPIRLRLVCSGAPASVVLDAATLTATSGAYAYQAEMGPQALWHAGADVLAERGGYLPDAYEGAVIVVNEPGDYAPILCGSWVQIRDGFDPSRGTLEAPHYDVDVASRVVKLVTTLRPYGATDQALTLSRRRADVAGLFGPDFGRAKLGGAALRPAAAGAPRFSYAWEYIEADNDYNLIVLAQRDGAHVAVEIEVEDDDDNISRTEVPFGEAEVLKIVAETRVPAAQVRTIRAWGWTVWDAGSGEGAGYRSRTWEVEVTSPRVDQLLGGIDGSLIDPATIEGAAFASTIAPIHPVSALPAAAGGPRFVFLETDGKLYRRNADSTAYELVKGSVLADDVVTNTLSALAARTGQLLVDEVLQIGAGGHLVAGVLNGTGGLYTGLAFGDLETSEGDSVYALVGVYEGEALLQIDVGGPNAGRLIASSAVINGSFSTGTAQLDDDGLTVDALGKSSSRIGFRLPLSGDVLGMAAFSNGAAGIIEFFGALGYNFDSGINVDGLVSAVGDIISNDGAHTLSSKANTNSLPTTTSGLGPPSGSAPHGSRYYDADNANWYTRLDSSWILE